MMTNMIQLSEYLECEVKIALRTTSLPFGCHFSCCEILRIKAAMMSENSLLAIYSQGFPACDQDAWCG